MAFDPNEKIDTSTPLTRTVSDLWDALGSRASNIAGAWGDDIGTTEKLAHTAAQTGGGLIDIASAPVGFLMDVAVPGTMGQDMIESLMQTEAGQHAKGKQKQ